MSEFDKEYFKKWMEMGNSDNTDATSDFVIPDYSIPDLGNMIQGKIDSVKPFDLQEWFKLNPPPISTAGKKDLAFVNESDNKDPQYETEGSSGFDLRANVDTIIHAKEYAVVPTGLFFEIPVGFEIQVRPRSGLAAKRGVTVLNSPGTVDADYTGELKVILINHGENDFVIAKGDRIAQGVCTTVTAKNLINLKRVKSINNSTDRGSGGFGSTGYR